MEIYRIGAKLETSQRPLTSGDRALVLLTTQEMEHPSQLSGLENMIRHLPSAQGARGCRVEARRDCLCVAAMPSYAAMEKIIGALS